MKHLADMKQCFCPHIDRASFNVGIGKDNRIITGRIVPILLEVKSNEGRDEPDTYYSAGAVSVNADIFV